MRFFGWRSLGLDASPEQYVGIEAGVVGIHVRERLRVGWQGNPHIRNSELCNLIANLEEVVAGAIEGAGMNVRARLRIY